MMSLPVILLLLASSWTPSEFASVGGITQTTQKSQSVSDWHSSQVSVFESDSVPSPSPPDWILSRGPPNEADVMATFRELNPRDNDLNFQINVKSGSSSIYLTSHLGKFAVHMILFISTILVNNGYI